MKKDERVLIPVDLRSESLEADLLDVLAGLPLFVQKMREGDQEVGPTLFANLIRLLGKADREKSDLRILGAFAPDMFYRRIIALESMDGHTRDFCKGTASLLFDQLRARGVMAFYILDNEIREDRFAALIELAETAGLHVISPRGLDSLSEPEVVQAINCQMTLRRHILYVEPDSSVNHLDRIKALAKDSDYVASFRNEAPSVPLIEIISLGSKRGKKKNGRGCRVDPRSG
jgi:hypothetical protein